MTETKKAMRAGRLLVAIYGVLAFAALGRSSYELIAKFSQAPLAYSLSAFAAMVYLVATLTLGRDSVLSRRIALVAVWIELIGVIAVGLATILQPSWFSNSASQVHTVWSYFGVGYGFVPLVLPFFGLSWLRRRQRANA